MSTYIIRRALFIIPTLLGITILTFLLTRLAGDPSDIRGNRGEGARQLTEQARNEIRALYGWDKPVPVAYWDWLCRVAQFNFGNSLDDHRKVTDKIVECMPITFALNATSVIISYSLAIPLGILSALKRGEVIDRTIALSLFVFYSIPTFVFGIFLIAFLAGGDYLNLFPMYGINSIAAPDMSLPAWIWDRIMHMVLPVLCLSYAGLASVSRYSRSSFLEVIGQDFIRTARAKGSSEWSVIFRHAMRNAMIPLVTIFALELPGLIGGSVIVEKLFSLSGMGKLALDSLLNLDQPVVMGVITLTALAVLAGNIFADILYAIIDPRIRFD